MYIMSEGFQGLRLKAYRNIAGSWGKIISADQAYQDRSLQVADRSDAFTPVHRNFRKVNNL
jgi:hypothetical protein